MQTISLKINSPDTIIPILKIAIDRERHILMETIRAAKEKVNKSAGNIAVDVNKLMDNFSKNPSRGRLSTQSQTRCSL